MVCLPLFCRATDAPHARCSSRAATVRAGFRARRSSAASGGAATGNGSALRYPRTKTFVGTPGTPCGFRPRAERRTWRSGIPRMPAVWRSLITWVVCFGVPSVSAQNVAGPPRLVSSPRVPLEGSVILLELRPGPPVGDSVTSVQGDLAGEPLHFERDTHGWRALGAV